MARLILVRHGESVANAERRFTHGPHEPLSRRGREEALARARRIQARFDPVALYASPYVRALETARVIGEVLALEPIVVDALREQDFGALRGQPYTAVGTDIQVQGRWRYCPPGGESLETVYHRAGPALDEIAHRHLGGQVVVVSHGGVMAALEAWCRGGLSADPVIRRNCAGFWLERRVACYEGPFSLDDDD